ncbi:MAG: hypothetical protein U5K56_07735 [Halioglobus sp.]|nr:hypothetical protein [Halioglobus sp.]
MPAATGSDAFVTVLKEAFDSQPMDLLGGPMEVFSDTLFADNLSESSNIAPNDTVVVGDNIALFFDTSDGPSMASLTSFEQRFSQITRDIPVPATLLLVLSGLFGLRVVAGRRA